VSTVDAASARALDVLLDPSLGPIVDMVLSSPEPDVFEVASCDGRIRFRRTQRGFAVLAVDGEDPLARQSSDHLVGIDAERANPHPHRRANAYPFAFEQVAQLFDHSSPPDLCVVHSAAHNWEGQGGHRGEHGSLGVVQARAPFVIAGKGVRADGYVPRVGRLVDVAPTLAALMGCEAPRGSDGVVLGDVLDPHAERPGHVVGFLFDGANANVLYAMARAGEAPNVARLIAMGTAYEWGAIAAMPTVTLANHTSILTGRFPGHHGILHNAWWDRARHERVITNSMATWPWSMRNLVEGVESLHSSIHRARPGTFTASVNEPCDVGADYSSFEFFRNGDVSGIPDGPNGIPHATERFVRPSKNYAWSTTVDYLCVDQATSIWEGEYRGTRYPQPQLMWCSFTLTDAAFHEGGPYSEIAAASVRDTDARVGAILDAVERVGVFDDTAFVLVADHGMQETDPAVRGDWDVALHAGGVQFRDEGYGFLYLGDS
jgi:hypothetical protein